MLARPRSALTLTIGLLIVAVASAACVFGGEGERDLSEFFPEAPADETAEEVAAETADGTTTEEQQAAADPTTSDPTAVPAQPVDERLLDVSVPPETALEAVQKYFALIASGRFEDAYRLLALDARERIAIDAFVGRHHDIWAEATITGLRWAIVPPPGPNVAGLEVNLVYETEFFGDVADRIFVRTLRQPNWVLDWTPDLIFDGLGEPGNLVHRFVDVPIRGDIFDRNGVPLAVKGEQAVIGISHDLIDTRDEDLVVATFVDKLGLDETSGAQPGLPGRAVVLLHPHRAARSQHVAGADRRVRAAGRAGHPGAPRDDPALPPGRDGGAHHRLHGRGQPRGAGRARVAGLPPRRRDRPRRRGGDLRIDAGGRARRAA